MEENVEDELEEEVKEPRKAKRQEEAGTGSKMPVMLALALILGAIAGALAGLAVQALFAEEDEDTPITIKDDNVGIGTTSPDSELDVDGVITAEGGNSDDWNTAYSWGDHSTEGYLTSYTETDPVYGVSVASGITSSDIIHWELAYGWGDHSNEGYLTSYTETDPVYGVSVAAGITNGDVTNWDTAHGWGDHALAGYDTTIDSWTGTGDVYTTSGNVGIGIASPNAKLHVDNGGFLITGTSGSTPISGSGTRMMWIPENSAFRAGSIDGVQWDDSNIGYCSSAMGYNTTAEGNYSTAFGYNTTARGYCSTTMGWDTIVTGDYSIAMGRGSSASGYAATAMGYLTDARGNYSIAMGHETIAIGNNSIAMGYQTEASGLTSTAMGRSTTASGYASTALGSFNTASGNCSTAIGRSMSVEGNYSVGIGLNFRLFGPWKISQDNTMAIMGGNVGIGTTNPSRKLHVMDGSICNEWSHPYDRAANVYVTNFNGASSIIPFADATRGIWSAVTSDGIDQKFAVTGLAEGDGGTKYGIYGGAMGSGTNYGGYFFGDVGVTGTLSKGGGSFKIDHPLDPENKYLYHSFVESPDMMNIYNGVVVLDDNGEAWIELPDWFETLNRDFRYQLTSIGAPGPNLYISEEIINNQFKISGGDPGMKVSWEVTGIRQDPWAEANRIPVEEFKSEQDRGKYLHPELYGMPANMGIGYIEHEMEDMVSIEESPLECNSEQYL